MGPRVQVCFPVGRLAESDLGEPADTATLSGETDLLRQQMGVPERGNDDQLVARPLRGLAEFDVERLSCPSDRLAVWQDHLARERSRGVGNYGYPVATSAPTRIRITLHVSGSTRADH